jgi:hypothetical protein
LSPVTNWTNVRVVSARGFRTKDTGSNPGEGKNEKKNLKVEEKKNLLKFEEKKNLLKFEEKKISSTLKKKILLQFKIKQIFKEKIAF